MATKNSRTLISSAVSLALSSMMLSASLNAAEIQSIDLSNFGPAGTTIRTLYDRDVTGGTAGAITYGEIGWDILKAMDPGIIVYNNTPVYGSNQIIADCVMAPRIDALLIPQSDGTFLDKQCNDSFQTHKRYKMSANAIGPIEMVFKVKNVDANAVIYDAKGNVVAVDQDVTRNIYRMIGKLNNHTGERLGGFTVQVGFGLGSGFYKSKANDGLKIGLHEEGADPTDPAVNYGDNDMAEFPGGLFYGPGDDKHDYGFFSNTRAGFTVDTAALATEEDFFGSVTITDNYSTLFGTWLPIDKVPQGWFYDFDGNPATDASLTAWDFGTDFVTWNDDFDWRYGNDPITGLPIDPAAVDSTTLTTWANTPSTVWDDDGDLPNAKDANGELIPQTLGGTLYATWNPETGVYDLEDGSGTTTNDDMTLLIAESATLERRPGYFKGPIEDLANLNLNYYIEVADASAWPTYNAADQTATFTLRITPLADGVTELPPPESEIAPVDPVPPTSDDDGGCTIGNNNRFDPVFPALVAMGLGYFGLRRFKASK